MLLMTIKVEIMTKKKIKKEVKQNNKNKYFLVCPRCGSKHVVDNRVYNDSNTVNRGLSLGCYCYDCYYTQSLFPELNEKGHKELLKKLAKYPNKMNPKLKDYQDVKSSWRLINIFAIVYFALMVISVLINEIFSLNLDVFWTFITTIILSIIITIIFYFKKR